MANRYTKAFDELRAHQQGAFIPFTVLGWPDAESCFQTVRAMIEEGATALELGVAFSDPVADGPTIQKAAYETLESGFSVADAFQLLSRIRQLDENIPIGILTYMNVVLAGGAERFFARAAQSGVDSVLIADLPPELAQEVVPHAQKNNVALVFIASPLTSSDRLKRIAELSSAYIYVVSRLGITGSDEQHDQHLSELLQRARRVTALPLLVGFGISSPAAARQMMRIHADGVITGSKIVELICLDRAPEFKVTRTFLREMRAALSIENSPSRLS